jgi:16S rRNA (guanine966-N2)-methyltransferase
MGRARKPAPRPRRAASSTRPIATRGALRVVAGTHRGRRFDAPEGIETRPTSDRVREAVFNALDSLDAVRGASTLDAFAGSGALGIEALSRGAAHVTFAESDARARATLEGNLAALALGERARSIAGPASRAVAVGGPWDLVLLDPPYAYDGWSELLAGVVAHLADEGVVVIESDREVELPAALETARTRTYSGTVVTFAVRAGATS